MAKYKIGDRVKVIKYGHLFWHNKAQEMTLPPAWRVYAENEYTQTIDMSPELVGREGIVIEMSEIGEYGSYVLHGIPQKTAWYNEGQLELVANGV